MLCQLNWPTLEHRRKVSKLVMLYKIHHRTVDVPPSYMIPSNTRMRGHNLRFVIPTASIHPGMPARILPQHHQNVECLTSSVGRYSLLRGIQRRPSQWWRLSNFGVFIALYSTFYIFCTFVFSAPHLLLGCDNTQLLEGWCIVHKEEELCAACEVRVYFYLDNNNCAPSFLTSLCEIGGDCFGPRYFSEQAQLPPPKNTEVLNSHRRIHTMTETKMVQSYYCH